MSSTLSPSSGFTHLGKRAVAHGILEPGFDEIVRGLRSRDAHLPGGGRYVIGYYDLCTPRGQGAIDRGARDGHIGEVRGRQSGDSSGCVGYHLREATAAAPGIGRAEKALRSAE